MMRIDGLVNLGDGIYKKQDVKAILREMDANGIDRSVLCPVEEYVTVYNREGNELVAKACRENPGKFYGYAVANPWYGKKAAETLADAFENGLHAALFVSSLQGFTICDPMVDPLIEVCRKYRKPAYVHTGTPSFALPLQLCYLARRFPDVNFIMGHCGANDFVYDIDASMRGMENLYLETSLNYCETIFKVVEDYPDRVIFGSDSPRSPLEFELGKALKASEDPDVMEKFLGGNLLRILEGGASE